MNRCSKVIVVSAAMIAFIPEAIGGSASDAIDGLNRQKQTDIFRKLINSADSQCDKVTKIFYKGDNTKDDSAYYAVRCHDGSDWMVSVQNGGKMGTRVTSCAMIKLVGLACWDPF